MVNIGSPRIAAEAAELDVAGVGLMRAEFLFYSLGQHPQTFIRDGSSDELLTVLKDGIRAVASPFAPRSVRYRTLDFKSNEMRSLVGGEEFEAVEGNPALGLRGASRYRRDRDLFMLELRALREVSEEGLDNLQVMIPFIRGAEELEFCAEAMREAGLAGVLELWAMIEVPALIYAIEEIAEHVSGISIGTNDLAQLMLGVDRDNNDVGYLYDDGHPAVVKATCSIIEAARAQGLQTSICGDRPSRDGAFVGALLASNVDTISVPHHAVAETREAMSAALSLQGSNKDGI